VRHHAASSVVLPWPATSAPISHSRGRGVPPDRFILDRQAQNTYQNAERSKSLMEQYGLHSAIVVSSDYHMRRDKPHVYPGL
jgi:uncharacterized SAM-binding protein YcdF (DUF218 family)